MKPVFTKAALKDLMDIARYIGRDDLPAARRFTAALRTRAEALGRNPRLYPLAAGFEAVRVRRRLYRGYLILYVEREDRVEILHIVHAARDWSRLVQDALRH